MACGLATRRLCPYARLSACFSALERLRLAHLLICTAMNRPATYSSARRLVFSICNILYRLIPTGPAIAARVPLVRSWAASSSCNDRGSQGPGARRGSVYLRCAKPYCKVSWHPVLRDLRKEPGFPCGQPVRHVWSHPTDLEYF